MKAVKIKAVQAALPALKKVFGKVRQDPAFREAFLADPKSILNQFGIPFPKSATLTIHQDTDKLKHISVSEVSSRENASAQIAALWKLTHRFREGIELRILHNTSTEKHLVLR